MGHCYCYYHYYGVSWQNVSSTSSSVASWQGVKLAEFHFFAAALDAAVPAAAAVPPLFISRVRLKFRESESGEPVRWGCATIH